MARRQSNENRNPVGPDTGINYNPLGGGFAGQQFGIGSPDEQQYQPQQTYPDETILEGRVDEWGEERDPRSYQPYIRGRRYRPPRQDYQQKGVLDSLIGTLVLIFLGVAIMIFVLIDRVVNPTIFIPFDLQLIFSCIIGLTIAIYAFIKISPKN